MFIKVEKSQDQLWFLPENLHVALLHVDYRQLIKYLIESVKEIEKRRKQLSHVLGPPLLRSDPQPRSTESVVIVITSSVTLSACCCSWWFRRCVRPEADHRQLSHRLFSKSCWNLYQTYTTGKSFLDVNAFPNILFLLSYIEVR